MDRTELLNTLLKRYNEYSELAAKHFLNSSEHWQSKKSALIDLFEDFGFNPGTDITCSEKTVDGITFRILANKHVH